jgi:hypothetical protein
MHLQEYLDEALLSKQQFAQKSGLSYHTIDNYLRLGKGIHRITALKIMRATDNKVTLKDLGLVN